jgi:GNAT superfamily N-acetyltransferase
VPAPQLRPARPADAAAIAHVHRLSRAWYYGTEADPADDRQAMWDHLLGEPGRTTWVAEDDGTVVGFGSWTRTTTPPVTRLEAMYVLPDRTGGGTGGRLHDQFEADRGGDVGELEVWAGNERAIAFYLRRGWVATEASRPGPNGLDFVAYRLPTADSR